MAVRRSEKYVKFLIYLVVVVLINIAGQTLFFRWDLTGNKIYSLSETSREVVATLKEPLTIKVFFTNNLPAPHNNTERYLRDLLEEYALSANRNFNFHFFDVSPQEGNIGLQAGANQQMADDYGINPVQIQMIEEDEVKFKRAYMGLVIIHGDVVERIPTITTTDGLEYKLTTAIQKLNNKTSALLNLKEDIKIRLYLSSSLNKVATYMGLDDLPAFARRLEEIIVPLNQQVYGKLDYAHIDPGQDAQAAEAARAAKIMQVNWPDIPQADIAAGNGMIGLTMTYGDKQISTPLLSVFRLPIVGTQYQMTPVEDMENIINENIEALVDINEKIGYLVSHGTHILSAGAPMGGPAQSPLGTFMQLLSDSYSIKRIDLKEDRIPASLKVLIIARPTALFTDYDLFQIDQALMRGTRLVLFLDAIGDSTPPGQPVFRQQPQFAPIQTGLERLLENWGVKIRPSIVLDENCFRQRLSGDMGGGERPIYFAPLIQSANINADEPYLESIRGLIALKMSPLELDPERLEAGGIQATRLFSSSPQSWEMSERITLDPMAIGGPPPPEDQQQFHLAYLLKGSFPSYFAGQPVPEKPAPAEAPDADAAEADIAAENPEAEAGAVDLNAIESAPARRDQGEPSHILVVGSSDLIQDTILEAGGRSPNSMFVMNVIDYLNDRAGVAAMRSKEQRFNPLEETEIATRTMTKAFNVIGIPVLVVAFGLLVWLRRATRKKRIQAMFSA
ncbi:MAG: Gldg family protein [Desulfobacterales bacterium]|nr:Gldg family protein [Desulfobacterales bacterium]